MIAQIEGAALAAAIRASPWAYPALEALHIAALATLFGSLLVLELRVFGAGRDLPLASLARLVSRTALAGFLVAAASGGLMWSSDAAALSANPAFLAKLALITLAGINAMLFHLRGSVERADAGARMQAGASLVLWAAAIAAGRLIAYV
ncbi:MAG: hypothetical protein ACXW2G_08955 [Burkholderiaceae bacterium]